MIINHNLNAMNAHRNMTENTTKAGKSMEKLSSGLRINRAGDDAAGGLTRARVSGWQTWARSESGGRRH